MGIKGGVGLREDWVGECFGRGLGFGLEKLEETHLEVVCVRVDAAAGDGVAEEQERGT
jgi:hypothetical protein